MFQMADRWKHRFGAAIAAAFLAAVLGSSGCSTFHERPGHSPFSTSRAKSGKGKKKPSPSRLSRIGSIFEKEQPRLAESPDEFVGLPRPEW
jgi:hypothetical protein